MPNHYQILVIGGGNAGLSVASQLLRKRSNLNIGIIDPSEKHYYPHGHWLVQGFLTSIRPFEMKKTLFQKTLLGSKKRCPNLCQMKTK
jgi:NADH dehydrogenase FAD-containing subunit